VGGTVRTFSAGGPKWELTLAVALIAVIVVLPHVGASSRLVYLVGFAVIAALVAYGFFVPLGLTGQLSMAIISSWACASFAVALASNHWAWDLALLLPLGVVTGGVSGLLYALPVMRTSGHYFIVVTFALVGLSVIVGQNWPLIDPNRSGVAIVNRPTLFGVEQTTRESLLYISVACLVVVYIAVRSLKGSGVGDRWAAVRENEQLAGAAGINVKAAKCAGLVVGGALAGVAAPLFVYYLRHIQIEEFGVAAAIESITIVILGGRTHVVGPIVGAVFYYVAPELLGFSPLVAQAAFGITLALVVIGWPDGLVAGAAAVVRWCRATVAPSATSTSAVLPTPDTLVVKEP
jgi:branched-chain amino acid transport system permease protein